MTKGPPARAIRRRARRAAPPTTPPRRGARADPCRAPHSWFLRAPPPRLRASRLRRLVGTPSTVDFGKAPRLLQAAPTRAPARGEYEGRCKPESGSSGPRAQNRLRGARAPGSTSTRHVQPGSPLSRARLLARPQAASAAGVSSSRARWCVARGSRACARCGRRGADADTLPEGHVHTGADPRARARRRPAARARGRDGGQQRGRRVRRGRPVGGGGGLSLGLILILILVLVGGGLAELAAEPAAAAAAGRAA
jgi:hypothetical protein